MKNVSAVDIRATVSSNYLFLLAYGIFVVAVVVVYLLLLLFDFFLLTSKPKENSEGVWWDRVTIKMYVSNELCELPNICVQLIKSSTPMRSTNPILITVA